MTRPVVQCSGMRHSVAFNNGYYRHLRNRRDKQSTRFSCIVSLSTVFEVQLGNNTPMSSRYVINSAPYAQMAGNAEVAESVNGGVVNASEIQVNNYQVVDGSGNWTGQPITFNWNNIDPNTIPSYIADGDDDTLASLSCGVGEIAGWGGPRICVSDATLSLSDIQSMLSNSAVDLNSGSTIGGLQILTGADDSDTLAGLSCVSDGEIAGMIYRANGIVIPMRTLWDNYLVRMEIAAFDSSVNAWVCSSSGGSGSSGTQQVVFRRLRLPMEQR